MSIGIQKTWYYKCDKGWTNGPLTIVELQLKLEQKEISLSTHVCDPDSKMHSKWTEISDLPQFHQLKKADSAPASDSGHRRLSLFHKKKHSKAKQSIITLKHSIENQFAILMRSFGNQDSINGSLQQWSALKQSIDLQFYSCVKQMSTLVATRNSAEIEIMRSKLEKTIANASMIETNIESQIRTLQSDNAILKMKIDKLESELNEYRIQLHQNTTKLELQQSELIDYSERQSHLETTLNNQYKYESEVGTDCKTKLKQLQQTLDQTFTSIEINQYSEWSHRDVLIWVDTIAKGHFSQNKNLKLCIQRTAVSGKDLKQWNTYFLTQTIRMKNESDRQLLLSNIARLGMNDPKTKAQMLYSRKQNKKALLCSLCKRSSEKMFQIMPCGHSALCTKCVHNIYTSPNGSKCPFCNGKIKSLARLGRLKTL